jgi:hypothetical protein
MMHLEIAAGRDFVADGRGPFGFMAYLDWPLHNMSLDMADAAMAGAVHHGWPRRSYRGSRGSAARRTAVFRANQGKDEQQRWQCNSEAESASESYPGPIAADVSRRKGARSESDFLSAHGISTAKDRVHFSSVL